MVTAAVAMVAIMIQNIARLALSLLLAPLQLATDLKALKIRT